MLGIISQNLFRLKKVIYLAIDDTLIKKQYAKFIQGTGAHCDTKIARYVNGFKIQVAAATDGKNIIPLDISYLFSKDTIHELQPSKLQLFQDMVKQAQNKFPDKIVVVVADGLFSTIEILKWCIENNISAEMRMHTNRKVLYKGQLIKLKNLSHLQPKGRHKARTINVEWHDLKISVTADKRRDKHGNESIVYLVSTFKDKPANHVATYKKRWGIEKMFRTTKQYLGLQDCQSKKLKIQFQHLASVFLSYSFLQIAQKKYKFENPEIAIRWFKSHTFEEIKSWITSLNRIIEGI
jgi:hypothetical protein